jgi:sulfatase modifying factor 1
MLNPDEFPSFAAISRPPVPAWATDTGCDTYGYWANLVVQGVTQRMRWIPPGSFVMGSSVQERERIYATHERCLFEKYLEFETAHQVTLSCGYWCADTACTQALWRAVMGTSPSRYDGNDAFPVESVSWHECAEFLDYINKLMPDGFFELPTEAQWEYACRSGTTTAYAFGENLSTQQARVSETPPPTSASESKGLTCGPLSASMFMPNSWGIFNMHGNVEEWCRDIFDTLSESPTVCIALGSPESRSVA